MTPATASAVLAIASRTVRTDCAYAVSLPRVRTAEGGLLLVDVEWIGTDAPKAVAEGSNLSVAISQWLRQKRYVGSEHFARIRASLSKKTREPRLVST